MNNSPNLNFQPNDSPKTPGGISKALLTPCRRVGLSRNWKKKGPIPFISPLASENNEKVTTTAIKGQSKPVHVPETSSSLEEIPETTSIVSTPKSVQIPRRSKSKKSLSKEELSESLAVKDCQLTGKIKSSNLAKNQVEGNGNATESLSTQAIIPETNSSCQDISGATGKVSTPKNVQIPHRSKSAKSLSKEKLAKPLAEDEDFKQTGKNVEDNASHQAKNLEIGLNIAMKSLGSQAINNTESIPSTSLSAANAISSKQPNKVTLDIASLPRSKSTTKKPKSPENLTKECFVVIQKKLLPREMRISSNSKENLDLAKENKPENKTIDNQTETKISDKVTSQVLFESDSDDVPLKTIKNKDNLESNCKKRPRPQAFNEDEDFVVESKSNSKVKRIEHKNTSTDSIIKKLEDKSTSITELKTDRKKTNKTANRNTISSQNLNNTIDDLDDFDLDCKKTILIRKTYDKVSKLSKAKSTGSITQEDIEDLKARIEIKKNLLLAKIKTKDTEELRSLIKKWRKGCQDALMELMDLMKTKFPDRQNMDYSEILQTLRIPPHLVEYDSDTDCFESQDEATMILARI